MPRLPEAPPPGVVRQGTPSATPNRWWDANNIRWRGEVMQPIGGNLLLPGTQVAEQPLDMITWHDNTYHRWAAFGTTSKLYAYNFTTSTLYDITPSGIGSIPPVQSNPSGYGMNTFGTDAYGVPRPIINTPPPGLIAIIGDWWSMDTFGENLMVVPTQDGRLFEWLPSTPSTVAAPVANAPAGNRAVVVTDQRSVVLLGAGGDPRSVAWSDIENPTVWTPGVANLAGQKELVTQAYVYCARKTPQGILIFTSNDVHLMQYVGPPYAYGITQIGAGCGPISLRAPIAVGNLVAWPSWQNFWIYSGMVQPLACDVKDWFFSSLNANSARHLFGSSNPQFAEIWWDFPDQSSTMPNRYLAFNYAAPFNMQVNRPWTIGRRARTCADPSGTLDYPVLGGPGAGGSGGALYQHENGWTDNGAPRASAGLVYAETGAIALGEGDRRHHVTQVVMDASTDPTQPGLGYRFFYKEQPYDSVETDSGLYTAVHNGLMDVRFSGRVTRMRCQATEDKFWSTGRPRLEVRQAGRR